MIRVNLMVVFFFILSWFFRKETVVPELFPIMTNQRDTLMEDQILYNGRIWRSQNYMVTGGQYLFSMEFLKGSLSINGNIFTDVNIKYDIYNDEILTPVDSGRILQLNKVMIDSFEIVFNNKSYKFIRLPEDIVSNFEGFVNEIYKGKISLYVRYTKKIEKLADERKYDKFYQLNRIYLLKNNILHLLTSKSDIIRVMCEENDLNKRFLKKYKQTISMKNPESLLPLLRYYDSLSN